MATLRRIKTLVLMQLTNRKQFNNKGKMKVLVFFLLKILQVVALTGLASVLILVFNNFLSIKINHNMLLFFIALTQVVSILSYTFSLQNTLYLSKDNAILLHYPVRHTEIFTSKMITLYIVEFVKNLKLILPVLIGFAIMGDAKVDIGFYFAIIPLLIVLPLIPIFIGAILSVPYLYIKRFLRKIPLLQTAVSFALLGAVMYIALKIVWMIPVPLRLLANYGKFATWLSGLIATIDKYLYGYQNIVNFLFPSRTIFDFLIMLAVVIGVAALAYIIVMPLFFNTVSRMSENSVEKTHKNIKNTKKGVFSTYFIKEVITMVRTPGKLFSYVSTVVTFPFLLYIINYIFAAINTNYLGHSMVIAFNLIIGITLLTANNAFASTAISSEGAEFSVLKTAPSKTYKIVWSKILLYQIASTLSLACGFAILGFATKLSTFEIVILCCVFLCVEIGHLLWSVQMDVLNPRLADVAAKGEGYNNPNVAKSIFAGLMVGLGFCLFALFFILDSNFGGLIRLLILGIFFVILRLVLFLLNLKVFFKRIEF